MTWITTTLRRRRADPAGAIGRDARAWVVRLAAGKVTTAEAQAFRRWHADDPRHAVAFAEAKLHWDVVGTATRELTSQPAFRPVRIEAAAGTRRWFLGAGLATAAAGVGVALVQPPFALWSPLVDLAADYRTGIGERRRVDLASDVTVELTTRSRLAVRADRPDGLSIALLAGEAAIGAQSRPVTVIAGPGEARTVRGRFDLRNDDGLVRVTCLAGELEVACGGRTVALGPAQQIRYAAQGMGPAETVDPDQITAWQRGILLFHDQPLGRVVEEVNRYRPGRIILTNPHLADRPVAAASFHLDRLDEVVPQIAALYGARARYLPGGIVLLG